MKGAERERGFTLVEMLVVIALIAVVSTMAGFTMRRMINSTRYDQEVNKIFGILMSTRGRALGNLITYVVVLWPDRLEVYREPNPGTYDVVALKNAIQSGTLLSTLTQDQVYQYQRVTLFQAETGTGQGGAATLALPVYLSFLPSGKVMVNDVSPIDVQNIHMTFRPVSGDDTDRHIVIYPYTGRMVAK